MTKATAKQNLNKLGKKLAAFARGNYLMLGYIFAAIIIELTGVAVTSGKFYMTEPWLYFTFVALPCLVSLFIPGNGRRYILFVIMLAANFVFDLIFIVVYDSTGTLFDYAMLNLRTDAMMIVESIPISFAYIFVSVIIVTLYCTLGIMLKKYMPTPRVAKVTTAVTSALLAVVITCDVMLVYFGNYKNNQDDLSFKLYQTETGTYSNKGLVGNFANELARGWWFSQIKMGDEAELTDFIYRDVTSPSPYFGAASGYNVVSILCESFEWFTFLQDAELYPNGYAKLLGEQKQPANEDAEESAALTEEELESRLHILFPNLYRLYEDDSTVILNNAHSLEKTDISENKSIIGNYPLYEYINYAYPRNELPYSLPNVMKELFGVTSKSFHDGYKAFYNRNIHHTHALGFESYTATEDMDIDDDDTGLGERNLDSVMMDACKAEMFPTDRRFNTFITTITQHGQYAYRENLADNYAKMDELGILPYREHDDDQNALRYYCAAGMDLDKAVGILLDYLDDNGLSDHTVVALFGDHNCYYQGISNYVKNIYSYSTENYTELYRVPVMIKIGDQTFTDDERFIEKYTCTADIYPTLLDLLGIIGFKNLMYGTSAFSGESSVLYSRAYDKFFTDKIYFNSLSNIIYQDESVDEQYIKEIEQKCTVLLDKISHVNRMFAGNYFAGSNKDMFVSRLKALNGITA